MNHSTESTDRRPAKSSRIWFVSEPYYPEESTGQLLTVLAEGLATRHEVHALCAQPNYWLRGVRVPRRELHNGVEIERCRGMTLNKNILALRAVYNLTIVLALFSLALRRVRKGDTILVVTNPPSLPYFMLFVGALRRARVVLAVMDVYPDVLVAAGLLPRRSSVTRAMEGVSSWLYRHVARVVVIGRDMKSLIAARMVKGDERLALIENWADLEEISPRGREENSLLATHGLTNRFVVQYAGNMGRTHGIDTLVDTAELLHAAEPDVHFLIVGSGARFSWARDEVAARKLSNVTILSTHPRGELESLLNACDIAVITFAPGMSGVSVPRRMYNIMASGKPILAVADADAEVARVIIEEEIGWVVAPGDAKAAVKAIAAAMLVARRSPEKIKAMGLRAREAAERRFNFPAALRKYEELFDSVRDGNDRDAVA